MSGERMPAFSALLCAKRSADGLEDTVDGEIDIAVCKPKNAKPSRAEIPVAASVVGTFLMLDAIDLDDKTRGHADEVTDVGPHGHLTSKSRVWKPTRQVPIESSLLIGHPAAQVAC